MALAPRAGSRNAFRRALLDTAKVRFIRTPSEIATNLENQTPGVGAPGVFPTG